MNGLQRLKNRLQQKSSETEELVVFYEVMKNVGGYENFIKLPIPAYIEIVEAMEKEAKEEQKMIDKSKHR